MGLGTILGGLIGGATSTGITESLNGIADAGLKIREIVTGQPAPEKLLEVTQHLADIDARLSEARSNVIMAEAKGQSWLQRNWRPLLMLVIIVIIGNNYIVYPYASIFTDKVKVLDLPDKLWALMEIGVGGYILGRTAEKLKGA